MTDSMFEIVKVNKSHNQLVFKGEMILDVSSFQNIIDLFAYDYEYMSAQLHQEKWVKELANMIFFQQNGHDMVYHANLGENTANLIFYKDNEMLVVKEDDMDDAFDMMESIGFTAFESIKISLIHILRYMMEHHKYPSNTCEPISFKGVRTVLVRDYENQKEISIPIEEMLNI